jgi:basic membrane protein A
VKRFKVAFVYPGTVNDQGWSQSHERGRIYLQQQLPDVETSYMAAVGVPDAELVLAELAEKGNRVIFAASSSFTEAVLRVAQRYPNVVFMICSGDKSATNVGAYAGRMYEPRFLSGLVAGKMTRTGIIGYVALSATPETVRDIDAFALGVRAVNPKAQVEVAWTENCLEPQRETDAEKSLLQDKADIIVQQRDDPAAQQPAAEQGVLFIGSNGDLSQPLPGADLLSTGANWGPMYVDLVRAVQNGTWKPGQVWGDISDGTVDLSPLNPVVPQDVRELVSRKRQQILAGEVSIFTGPLRDQQGKLRVKADQTMTDAQLLSMDWFVPGVKLPASKRPGS